MTHTKKDKPENFRLAILFIAVVLFFAFVSFSFKIFFLVKESTFDPNNNFNVEIVEGGERDVVSFSPKDKTISVLQIGPKINTQNLSLFLSIPIDAKISTDDKSFDPNHITSFFIKSTFAFHKNFVQLTSLDSLRLALFARTVSGSFVKIETINGQETEDLKIISQSFKDSGIEEEGLSIEVVNATDTFGLGSRLAALISNIGGSVILVSTKDVQKKSEIIYQNDEGYTVKRLSKYLEFPKAKTNKRGVADVTIIIGEDKVEGGKF